MPTYIRDGGVWKEVSGSSLPEGSTFLTGTFTNDDVEEFNNLLTAGHLDDIYGLSIPTP